MAREFKLPDVGEGVAEGEIVDWLVRKGDAVSEDQPVAEVETDKAVVEVPSPVNGSIQELHAEAGDVVPVGDVIVTFAVENENGEAASTENADESGAADRPPSTEPVVEDTESKSEPSTDQSKASPSEVSAERTTPSGRVFAAPSARRLARELGVDIGRIEGSGPAGRVVAGDVKAAANGQGSSSDAAPQEGDSVPAAVTSAETDAASSAVSDRIEEGGTELSEPAARDRTLAAPATRRVARELGIDLDTVPATEERAGEAFVTAEAVREHATAEHETNEADARALAGTDVGADVDTAGDERVPYRGIRRTIGRAMERSAYTAPHVTHHDTVEASALVETRAALKPAATERGVSLTYLPIVMKACVAALREFPYLNSSLDEESGEIVLKKQYNLGIAVGTDAGLMVPVVDGVDRKGLLEIASEANELIEKTRDRSITREEMQGGTFTITNFGAIGGEYATPLINYPETAILGLGAITERPVAVEGEVLARPTLPLSLSIDHRVVDGATAARFSNRVGEYLRDPRLLLLD